MRSVAGDGGWLEPPLEGLLEPFLEVTLEVTLEGVLEGGRTGRARDTPVQHADAETWGKAFTPVDKCGDDGESLWTERAEL
ncbi:hypothetical protein ACH47B_21465 [Rhodococcus sp. NPDC019627]|uniref:hypothetical protein n=1 Tax=unclassified Rhodococcus (in: high G+C Gram-positive bacteria) TaxID=192944 RepID=UPI0033D53DD6